MRLASGPAELGLSIGQRGRGAGNAEQRRGVPARGGRKEGRRGHWRVGPGGQTQSGVNGQAAERERAGALADEWGRPVSRAQAHGRANAGWSGSARELGLAASLGRGKEGVGPGERKGKRAELGLLG